MTPDPLTPRETEIVRLVATGLSNQEIADLLTIGERTARTHVHQALQKTCTRNRVQLTLWAQRTGLVELPVDEATRFRRHVLRDLRRLLDDYERRESGS